MYIEIDKLPDISRVWIYQSERQLKDEEMELGSAMVVRFLEQWTAHSRELWSSFSFENNHFLIIAVNEEIAGASGCSIDASVRFLEELGRKLNTSFFDRRIPIVLDDNLVFVSTQQVKELSNLGKIDENTVFYNNLVTQLGELRYNWKQKAGDSWLVRFLAKKEETLK